MPKTIIFGSEARRKLLDGITLVYNSVGTTMGPSGSVVVLGSSYGSPKVTKDGVTVAKEVDHKDPHAKFGVDLLKEVATKTSDVAGDGTTTATVMAHAIAQYSLSAIETGVRRGDFLSGLDRAADCIVGELKKMAVPVSSSKDIAQVGTISANSDPEIGEMIANAMEKVGKDGVITVEEGSTLENELDIVEGMQFDRGYLSPYFVTNQTSMEARLDDCYIFVADMKIGNIREIIKLLEEVAKQGRSLLIIAEDVEGEALATLIINMIRGIVKVVAVKAPGFGDRRKAMLGDIAVLTGAELVSTEKGLGLQDTTMEMFGVAKRVVVTKDTTTIVGGKGSKGAIEDRIAHIKQEISSTASEYDKEKLQERLAKLSGGVGIVKVGGATEVEMKEKKARVEDALHATRAAVEDGVIPGGGVALIRASASLDKIKPKNDAERLGIKALHKAALSPAWQILSNTTFVEQPELVIEKIKNGEGAFGYDAREGKFCDLIEEGIIDPLKVALVALESALSIVKIILQSECLIAEEPSKDEGSAAGGGHMGGMGGMPGMM